ncbi:hypothetical protein Tsubulata_049097 [Turnera subulata]|uniref:TF-B3 domain-containing protein n=1 Tax=Turnera subulata TaxID=218843 RepID=A0A9Q0F6L9_9ROSI|nr:hypothetical protein Tsubulata_049097 [Turnera subulata]
MENKYYCDYDEEVLDAAETLILMKHQTIDEETSYRLREILKNAAREKAYTRENNSSLELRKQQTLVRQVEEDNLGYCASRLPPVAPQLLPDGMERCSQPLVRILTNSDVDPGQARLALTKAHVEKHLLPMLNERKVLEDGLPVTVYDGEGRIYSMIFKAWVAGRTPVLTSGWKSFVNDHNLKANDVVTVWMFRSCKMSPRFGFVIKITGRATSAE